MREIQVSAEGSVGGPPEQVYRLIADYNRHHPRFLPPNFSNLKVVEGSGVGEGTVITFDSKAGGRTRLFRARITEPQPGRVLVEADTLSSIVTTFTVRPAGGGSHVRIETRWQPKGVQGFFERLLAPRLLRRIYADELARLDRYARSVSG